MKWSGHQVLSSADMNGPLQTDVKPSYGLIKQRENSSFKLQPVLVQRNVLRWCKIYHA